MPEKIQGRGASFNPGNRFERLHLDEFSEDGESRKGLRLPTIYYKDTSRSILAKNDSPDVPFTFSVNPYRGCEHGCVYCYARPTHEFLGFSAGLDFETRIMVKMDVAALLDQAFRNPAFEPQVIALSGNTDCYQPVERKLQLSRKCLEVFLKYRNPVGIITKNSMILRDLDLLVELNRWHLVSVSISITSLDPELSSTMEPRAATPEKRLDVVRSLADAGIPVGVNVAPVIPGLTDEEIPEILRRSAESGAWSADYIVVRLPYAVKEIFQEWVRREYPLRAEKILNRIRSIRSGELSDPRFHSRMSGEGEFARLLANMFEIHCKRNGLNERSSGITAKHFLRPGQINLFE